MIGFTKSLARELGSRGVRANVVAPGYVETRLTDVLPEDAKAAMLADHAARPARGARRTSPGRYGSSAPTRPRSSRARCCSSTADWGCRWRCERQRTQTGRGHRDRDGLAARRTASTTSWRRLLAGESGAAEITLFDHRDYPVHFACELKDFEPTDWIDHKSARRMDRFAQMILAAARQAEQDSGLDIAADPERVGASIATGIGGLRSFQDCYDVLRERGPDRVSPFSIPCIIPNMGAGWVSIELGTKGPLMSQCTACAASNMAIGDALDEIRMGRADAMIAGGTEAPITRVGIAGFDAMRALSRRNDDPQRRLAAVRQGPRRARDGRGGGRARARGARARPGARREDLRRADRLRHVRGRRRT